jgi:hypothetical protein
MLEEDLMLRKSLGAFAVMTALAAACSGKSTDVGGVAGVGATSGAAGTTGVGGGGSGAAGTGGGGAGCPADLLAAEGTPCAEEGKSCGDCSDPCSFCNLLRCENGKWQALEAFPNPNCGDAGGVCGGYFPVPCPEGYYCDFPPGCGVADETGICVKTPEVCDDDCPGVCGCDGQLYCNACMANAAGIDTSNGTECSAGDGGAGTVCGSDFQCAAGLKCCYPCGIPGCENQCMTPWANGECPMFP